MSPVTKTTCFLKPINCLFALIIAILCLQILFSIYSEETHATDNLNITSFVAAANIEDRQEKVKRTMGVVAADCKKCHPSEVATWMKTVHFQSPDLRLYKFEGNTKKYAEAMGMTNANLLADSMCADCHATKAVRDGEVKVISGVSCEKCHGAAGGENGWLNRHQSYHANKPIPRAQETAEHRAERLKFCDEAGMIRSENIYGISKSCFSCHIVGNEKLIAAGHKAASAFDFVSWSSGEVKHNFFVDKTNNAEAPSLWMERTGGKPENRKRMKLVIGTLVQLEFALRTRAGATNPAVIPQFGGIAAAANGKLAQINAFAPTAEIQAVTALITPLLGTLFVPQQTDKVTYSQAADKVAEQTKLFSKNHDGSKFAGLDAMIKQFPPHYSQQYKQKYQTN